MKLWKIALLLVAAASNPLQSIPTESGLKVDANERSSSIEHPLLAKGALPFHKLPKDQSRNPAFTLFPVKGGIDNNPNAWPTFFDDLKNGFKARVVSDKKLTKTEAIDKALEWASDSMSGNLPQGSKFVVKSAIRTKSNGLFHIHLRQVIDKNGSLHEIYNADVNINMDAYGNVLSFGETVFSGSIESDNSETPLKVKSKKHRDILALSDFHAEIDSAEAFRQLLRHFMEEGKSEDDYGLSWINNVREEEAHHDFVPEEDDRDELRMHPNFHKTRPMKLVKSSHDEEFKSHASVGYMQDADGKTLTKVWNVQADFGNHWVESNVCVKSGKVKSVNDWVSHANYKVYPVGVNDPEDGKRRLVRQPEDSWASPNGWLDPKEKHPRTTHGNNVWAQANWEGKSNPRWKTMKRPKINSANETFAYQVDLEKDPHEYVNAATVNLFYWNNIMHDISYQYGFDEESGNFQDDNFDRGGLGNDAVLAMSQAGEGTDNANFATPPDGGRPRMNMYLWDLSKPYRDGDFDAGIIAHEYTHGISTRLTGGPANSNCLWNGEAGGMGEGWGDFFATLLRQRSEYNRNTDFLMGSYVYQGKTIRKYPYSTNMKTNPETYAYIKKYAYWGVHAKGEVWAGILLESYWNFIDTYGFDEDWYSGSGGNNKMLKNVIDGMKLQPCNPTFVDARNAILQADEVNFNGDNQCLLWQGFAKRGLGTKAKAGGHESFDIPSFCMADDYFKK